MELKRIISGIIYIGIVLWAVLTLESNDLFIATFGSLIPMLMIWYPEQVNDYTLGLSGEGRTIDKPTPAFMISAIGWLILFTIPLAIFYK